MKGLSFQVMVIIIIFVIVLMVALAFLTVGRGYIEGLIDQILKLLGGG